MIVVTQFDRTVEPDDTDEGITVEKVQEKVCQSVRKACPDVNISVDDVLPLSGLWAYHARMLAMSHPDEREYSKYRRKAEKYLSDYQSFPCGQGENQSTCLRNQSDDELATKLLDISRFASLEGRYIG